MNQTIDTIKTTRLHLLQLIAELSTDQLNEVPAGFNNNIIWNVAHLAAATQGVCYLRADIKMRLDESFYAQYKPGTKPEGFIDTDNIAHIKAVLLSSLDV